ncbi:LCP family protein [Enterococcus asini]|uniref:LCP family protein n=1 Tax=Enterococcus asini TaxID=57732 RepID=A0AAW8U3E8_9ENTE|nr:LCP family protein [Enterococcus asini]MDT2764819.1 LCP family protein [Enterococcus asini]MDT2811254.1 LCP family protein [Enterococcus asini]
MEKRGVRLSRGKKIILGIVGVIFALTLIVVGVGAKVYFDVKGSVDNTYESVKRTQPNREKEVDLKNQEPFSVLLLGIDTGDLGRTEQGRSDTMMIATVNPRDKKTTIVSIPRDTYVPIVGYGTEDKINHAYAFGGAAMSMDTVASYLDIPVDHYAAINMKGLKELVDAVGGITVGNEMEFTQDNYTFKHGQITLDGDMALSYSRMRHDDPRGDYGRQERQRTIVMGVVNKLLSMDGITKYQEVLNAMESNVKTDMTFDTMKTIALDYRDAFANVKTEQMQGEGFMQDNISYQRVSDEELKRIQTILDQELGI